MFKPGDTPTAVGCADEMAGAIRVDGRGHKGPPSFVVGGVKGSVGVKLELVPACEREAGARRVDQQRRGRMHVDSVDVTPVHRLSPVYKLLTEDEFSGHDAMHDVGGRSPSMEGKDRGRRCGYCWGGSPSVP